MAKATQRSLPSRVTRVEKLRPLTVVQRHGDGDGDRLLALLEDVDEVRVDVEGRRDTAELLAGDLERVLEQV